MEKRMIHCGKVKEEIHGSHPTSSTVKGLIHLAPTYKTPLDEAPLSNNDSMYEMLSFVKPVIPQKVKKMYSVNYSAA